MPKVIKKKENEINEKILMKFIKQCYDEELIMLKEAISLNLYVGQLKTKTVSENAKVKQIVEEKILEENVVSILEDLRTIFSRYGYNYDEIKISEKNRKMIEKYGSIEYIEKILSKLKEYGITSEMLETRQGIICDIFITKDIESLEKIDKFIKENDCSLYDLLEMSSIFYDGKKILVFKEKTNDGIKSLKTKEIIGDQNSFFKNVELYKNCNKLDSKYKMTKVDFNNRIEFFTASHDKLLYNLSILKKYGIIEKGSLPNKLSFLNGVNITYLLDRCIESGIYEYCCKNPSILRETADRFRWYKIKRAKDLQQDLFSKGGLKSELKSKDKDYGGITLNKESQIIEQVPLGKEEMQLGQKKLDYNMKINQYNHPEANLEFNYLYRYKEYEINEIFRHTNLSKIMITLIVSKLNEKHNFSDQNLQLALEDPYIKMLETQMLSQKNQEFKCKVDGLRYKFVDPAYKGHELTISRLKVLNLVGELKKNNLWINDEMSVADKANLLISVLLKDSIVSPSEQSMIRFTTTKILNDNLDLANSRERGSAR